VAVNHSHARYVTDRVGVMSHSNYGARVSLSDSLNEMDGTGTAALAEPTSTLRTLVATVGSPAIRVLAAPRGLDVQVCATALLDVTDVLGSEPDAILLMAGVRIDDPAAIELVQQAALGGYCAVVVKRRTCDLAPLVAAASTHGIAVLEVATEVSWRHLDALLLAAMGSQGLASESHGGVGDELFALANAIAAVIGGSVAIEDLERRVVAYSSQANQRIDALRTQGILDRRVPVMDRNSAQYREVMASAGVVRFVEKTDELARAAIAIKAGTQPLGTIWAIEGNDGLDDEGERTLVQGARLAALKILRGRDASGLELQLREAALLRALDGSLNGHETGFRLSLPGGSDLTLVGFAGVADAAGTVPLITHIASALARYVMAYRPDASMATTSRAVYLLLPSGGLAAADRFANGALGATHTTFPDAVRSAISFSSSDPDQLPIMRREIDDILRVTTVQLDLASIARLADVHTRAAGSSRRRTCPRATLAPPGS
jgi:hypothetical protein